VRQEKVVRRHQATCETRRSVVRQAQMNEEWLKQTAVVRRWGQLMGIAHTVIVVRRNREAVSRVTRMERRPVETLVAIPRLADNRPMGALRRVALRYRDTTA
jgi:hypothetical protein